ncbi:MAG: flagellar filament capping protein FliD [Magnetococcales bacterium]|nr:flagellar filament capping protein FliD [Magnetococcales bacterium]
MAIGNVQFGGLASGLPSDIVDQLMNAEKVRLTGMQNQRTGYQREQSAISTLKGKLLSMKSAMTAMQDTASFRPHTAASSDTDKMTVTASSEARSGFHSVNVTSLATYQSYVSHAGVSSQTAQLASDGQLSFSYNGTSYGVALAAGDTLSDVAQKINAVNYGNDRSKGVVASVMNDGSSYRLVLTTRDSGTNNGASRIVLDASSSIDFGAEGSWDGSTGGTTGFDETVAGTDAALTVDGIAVTSGSNTVNSAIPGVTLSLKQLGSANITIGNDAASLKSTVQNFIKSYNDVVDYVNTETQKGNSLAQDASMVRGIITQLRREINTPTSDLQPPYGQQTPFATLSQLGIRTDKDTGRLAINDSVFDAAAATRFDDIANLFTNKPESIDAAAFSSAGGKRGLAYRLSDVMGNFTASSGSVLSGKTSSIDSGLRSIDDRIAREQTRLDKVKDNLTKKFANLEKLMSSMNNSTSSLTSAISSLSNK